METEYNKPATCQSIGARWNSNRLVKLPSARRSKSDLRGRRSHEPRREAMKRDLDRRNEQNTEQETQKAPTVLI